MTKKDTSEYSSSKAPETRKHAEEKAGNMTDPRLIPGGSRGSSAPQGIEALDRQNVPNGATDTAQARDGHSPAEQEADRKIPR